MDLERMGERLAGIVVGAISLASVDLAVKSQLSTSPLLLHERSQAWLILSVALLAGCSALAFVPSRLVVGAAGFAAGGLLGNVASALEHHGAVPDPLLLGGIQHGVAFNLADVFFMLGLLGLMAAALVKRRLVGRCR